MIRYAMLFLALVSVARSLWRAPVAIHHYQSSLAINDDPSMRELEQLAAGVDSGLSLIMLVHGAAFFAFFRRGLVVRWRHTGAVALVCAIVVSGSLGGIPLLSTFGLYPLTIIVSVGVLAHYIAANWISLYLGAGIGSTIGAFVGAPVIDGFVWLAIVGPCVLLAFIGAGLSHLFLRLSATSSSL